MAITNAASSGQAECAIGVLVSSPPVGAAASAMTIAVNAATDPTERSN